MHAFNSNWKTVLLICICTTPILPCTWYLLVTPAGRTAAEDARRASKKSRGGGGSSTNSSTVDPSTAAPEGAAPDGRRARSGAGGFGPERTRLGFFCKVLLPVYVLPLAVSTALAMIALLGLAPTFMFLRVYRDAPKSDLAYQLACTSFSPFQLSPPPHQSNPHFPFRYSPPPDLAYGTAQFLASLLSTAHPLPHLSTPWLYPLLQTALLAVGIAQLFVAPLLTYYGVWIVFVLLHGGIVGAAVVSTNRRIAGDFGERGQEVRGFALRYGGLGSVVGDVVGGALAIMVQRLAVEGLEVRGPPRVGMGP